MWFDRPLRPVAEAYACDPRSARVQPSDPDASAPTEPSKSG
jgi:hypothetical protein